jgi:hypothetical protein
VFGTYLSSRERGSAKWGAEDGGGSVRMASSASSVREARVGELAQLSATLADAFATEPITQWLIPSQRRRDTRLRRLFAIELAHYVFPSGRALTTDDFRGVNLELPPSRWTMTVPLSGAIGYVRVFGMRLPRASRLQVFFERNHLQEPHYYIRWVGVATSFQGQGAWARRCCVPRLIAATGRACPRTSKPALSAARRYTSGSGSSTSASCKSRTDPGSGRCDGHR